MDYDSENSDDYAQYSDEILLENAEDSQLKSIGIFKNYISKEPEFCGIHSISSFEILEFFRNPLISGSKKHLTHYQYELFNELGNIITGRTYPMEYYNSVFEKIYNRIYV